MRVLQLTNMWPDQRRPHWGPFVKAQVDALTGLGVCSTVQVVDGDTSRLNYLRAVPTLWRAVHAGEYDLVHAHYGLTGVVAASLVGTPVVLSLYGSDVNVGWQRACSVLAGLRAHQVTVCSSQMAARLPGRVRPTILPPGVDARRLGPQDRMAARHRLGIADNARVVLFPADPKRPVKDFPLFLAAVDRLKMDNVQTLTLGAVPDEDLPHLYSAADCVLLTSRSEGSPTVVKEALVCGCPVVCVDVGDVRELLEGEQSCQVVAGRDPASLAEAVTRCLGSTMRPASQAAAARFSLDTMARRLLEVYRLALRR